MTPKQLRKIADAITELEREFKKPYVQSSGGFAIGNYLSTRDGKVYVEMRFGVQSDCSDNVRSELVVLSAFTLKVINQ